MSTPRDDFITDTESGSSEGGSGSEEDVASWISWFCSLKGNEFFCEIEEDYIQDDFNLSGLSSQVACSPFNFLSTPFDIISACQHTFDDSQENDKGQGKGVQDQEAMAIHLAHDLALNSGGLR